MVSRFLFTTDTFLHPFYSHYKYIYITHKSENWPVFRQTCCFARARSRTLLTRKLNAQPSRKQCKPDCQTYYEYIALLKNASWFFILEYWLTVCVWCMVYQPDVDLWLELNLLVLLLQPIQNNYRCLEILKLTAQMDSVWGFHWF